MKITPKLLIVAGIVLIYTFTFGLIIPGFFDELGMVAVAYFMFGRG